LSLNNSVQLTVGPGGPGVVLGGLGERGEAIVWWGAGRGQNAFVGPCSVSVLIFPTARRIVRGAVRGALVLSLAFIERTGNRWFSGIWFVFHERILAELADSFELIERTNF
jgi:hypothetical protein